MPVSHLTWLQNIKKFEDDHFATCTLLQLIGGSKERCSSVDRDLNVALAWTTQFIMLALILPVFCVFVTRSTDNTRFQSCGSLKCYKEGYTTNDDCWHFAERVTVPLLTFLCLATLLYWLMATSPFTYFFFTFFSVFLQTVCTAVLVTRCLAERYWFKGRRADHALKTALRLYSIILLVHTFATTVFIVLALLIYALSNRKLVHVVFIYKLLDGSPHLIANEIVHTIPVLVYLFLVKTHYFEDLTAAQKFLSARFSDTRLDTVCFYAVLQIPAMTYILLVNWNCVYGNLDHPDWMSSAASVCSYIAFAMIFFSCVHVYVTNRILLSEHKWG